MTNLDFSSPIDLQIADDRNGVMLDYMSKLHHYYLTHRKNPDTGALIYDENSVPVLCIMKEDYSIDRERNYKNIENIVAEYSENDICAKQERSYAHQSGSLLQPLDVLSFNVKNLANGPSTLKDVYGFINVKNEAVPVFRCKDKLNTVLTVDSLENITNEIS